MKRILYYGMFFDNDVKNMIASLDENPLDIKTNDLHVTFRYLPNSDERINDIVGKEYSLKIVGISNNGKNSGVLIEIPEKLRKYYIHRYEKDGIEIPIIPHLTLSTAKDSKNRYTRDLDFKSIENPITITGKFGYCIEQIPGEKNSRYITYEKVL